MLKYLLHVVFKERKVARKQKEIKIQKEEAQAKMK